jgi:prenyltransferase beta subunit
LGELPPHQDALANFVCGQPPNGQLYELYFRTFTLDILHRTDPDHSLVKDMVNGLPLNFSEPSRRAALNGQLEHLLLVLRLKEQFGLTFFTGSLTKTLLGLENPIGGFGTPSNLLDTHLVISVLALCGQSTSLKTETFVSQMALPNFAFRLTQNSLLPTLETVCAGIECCRALNLPVAYPEDAASFILACQAHNGGFARAPAALPDIGLTHLALQGMESLFKYAPVHEHN